MDQVDRNKYERKEVWHHASFSCIISDILAARMGRNPQKISDTFPRIPRQVPPEGLELTEERGKHMAVKSTSHKNDTKKKNEGQAKKANGQANKINGQAKKTNGQAKKTNGQAKKNTASRKVADRKKASGKAVSKEWPKKLALGFGAVVVLYVLAAFFFSSRYFPRTEINGFSCQFKTVEQVKEMIRKGCMEYELVLEEREEKEEKLTSDQVALQFVDDGRLETIKSEQKSYAWIGAIFHKPVYEDAVTITYDENALIQSVDALECLKAENMKDPEAAYPSYVKESGKFEIVKEKLGTLVDKDSLMEKIRHALLSDQRNLNLSDENCYVEPAFYSGDKAILDATEKINRYLSTEITYDMGYTEVKVDQEQIASWLLTDEQANVIVDTDKVGDYVDWLGRNYNTCGIPRVFHTPENITVTVSGGTYGWRIHFQKEVEQLSLDVTTGEKIKREPVYRQTAYNRDQNGNDLHDTYIAISINAQTMWYYKNGQCLLTTPVVTGNTSKKMGTPTGVYEIAFKQRDHVLRGEDYESPVDYWLPFYEYRGIGIHDADWRAADAFGGVIYQTNGSHGCVNTPYEAVKSLFEMVKTGTPVVVY
ncbi:MAG: hypothetical protein E7253_07715 [Lachnospiraceae bacterium]|nr:hypothetical protein [Lachnospiraceae bacterium]